MSRSVEGDGRSGATGTRGSRVVALTILLGAAIAADVTVRTVSGPSGAVLAVVVAAALFQWGRVHIRLSNAPVYPRANYYGEADIAPEAPGAEERARRASVHGGAVAAAAAAFAGATTWLAGWGAPVGTLPLAAGIAIETWRAARRDSSRMEESLRGRYVLYLRSFSAARPWVVVAVTMAAAPARVVAVLNPRRTEVRSLSWYVFGALLPVQFARVDFWATSSDQWNRVVASCMSSSRAMVVDCTGARSGYPRDGPVSGLQLEAGLSHSFAAAHPTAYLTERGRPLPVRAPAPTTLQITPTLIWLVGRFPRLVRRLRAVITRRLSEDEQAYLDRYYAEFMQSYGAAAVSDRNLAAREGRRDPRELLMARDPLAALQAESDDADGLGAPDAVDRGDHGVAGRDRDVGR